MASHLYGQERYTGPSDVESNPESQKKQPLDSDSAMMNQGEVAAAAADSANDDHEGTAKQADDHDNQLAADANAHFHRLGWKRLAVVTVVEAIALGALSLPGAYHTLGMFPGVLLTVSLGAVAIFTSYLVGQVKLRYPGVANYAEAGRLLFGRWGYEIFGVALVCELMLVVGSHALTGSIALIDMSDGKICSVAFSAVSAVILFVLAIPPSFSEVAILGYIDFASIVAAIGITVIATGIQAGNADGGMSAVDWSAWPKEDLGFAEAFVATSNIIFAFSFAIGQFSFMDEMHTPGDYMKSIWTSGIVQIFIYTLTGALCYAFVGSTVESPALLSAGPLVSKIAFGVALPVIFISGSINTTIALRYVHGRMFSNSVMRYVNTPKGWASWIVLVLVFTLLAWVVAEAIPIFSDLLSLASALFVSGFSFWIPAVMWFMLLREGKWYEKKILAVAAGCLLAFVIGVITLVAGTYATIQDIVSQNRCHIILEKQLTIVCVDYDYVERLCTQAFCLSFLIKEFG